MDAQSLTCPISPAGNRHKRHSSERRLSGTGILAWSFAVIWLVVTTLPIWWIFNIVFSKGGSEVALSPHLYPTSFSSGILHLQQALSQASFLQAYLVSSAYAFVQVGGMLLIVSMAAYEFTFYYFPGKTALFLIALSGLMMPCAEYGEFQRVIAVDEINLIERDDPVWRTLVRGARLADTPAGRRGCV